MANYFVDSAAVDDTGNGLTTDTAWKTIKNAVENESLTAGSKVWVKRDTHEAPGANDITIADAGGVGNPIYIIGWPRASESKNCDWVNGSTTVDNVDENDMDREQHLGRYVTGPDSNDYLITKITDTNTFIIDREYAGGTLANQDVTIKADEDYAEAQAIDDAAWTIKLSTWTDDAADLPYIDFAANANQIYALSKYHWSWRNIEFRGSTDTNGCIIVWRCRTWEFLGCLWQQDENASALLIRRCGVSLKRCIIEGDSEGALQVGLWLEGGDVKLTDIAIYNMGDVGMFMDGGTALVDNVNIGVEVGNDDVDIYFDYECGFGWVYGRDLKLGGTIGYFGKNSFNQQRGHSPGVFINIENWQKVLGEHRHYYNGGYVERSAVSGDTANKKVSNYVIEIVPNVVSEDHLDPFAFEIFCHEFEATTASKTYKYWLFNDTGNELNDSGAGIGAKEDIWLEAEYVITYDDTSEYFITKKLSTEVDIANHADADDWDYLQVAAVQPAVASKVRIKCYCRHYDANGSILIDPAVVIS